MKTVSPEYQTAITKLLNRRIVGKVQIDWTSPEGDESIVILPNEENHTTQNKQTADGIIVPTYKWASLDGSWVLDGTYHLAPDTEFWAQLFEMGWWGNTLSLPDNFFPNFSQRLYGERIYHEEIYGGSKEYPLLRIYFSSRPLRTLMVVGDKLRNEYPVDFEIRIYDNQGVLVHTEVVNGNGSWYWEKDITHLNLTEIIRMDLVIKKWNKDGRVTKILEFFTSIKETYEGDDLFLISLLEEREVKEGSLPIGNISANEITIRLNNVFRHFDAGNQNSKLYGLVKANRKIKAWVGVIKEDDEKEYIPLGIFWSGDWEVLEKEIYAETTGRDLLERMAKTEYYTNEIITNPADTIDTFDTQAEWNEGTMINIKSDPSGKIMLDI